MHVSSPEYSYLVYTCYRNWPYSVELTCTRLLARMFWNKLDCGHFVCLFLHCSSWPQQTSIGWNSLTPCNSRMVTWIEWPSNGNGARSKRENFEWLNPLSILCITEKHFKMQKKNGDVVWQVALRTRNRVRYRKRRPLKAVTYREKGQRCHMGATKG